MIRYKVFKKSIIVNNKKIDFQLNVSKVSEVENILIVFLEFNPKKMDNEPNVFAISNEGEVLWQLDFIENSCNKYIDIKSEKDRYVIYDYEHFKYILDEKTGKLDHKKIMPLKDIDDNSKTLFTKNNFLQLLVIFIFFVMIAFIFKHLLNSQTYVNNIEDLKTTSIEETSIVQEDENEKTRDELFQEEINDYIEKNDSTIFEFADELTSRNVIEEPIQNNNVKEDINPFDKEDKEKYEGFNMFVGFVNKFSRAIETGEAKTIDDARPQNINEVKYIETLDNGLILASLNGQDITLKLISIKQYDDTYLQIDSYLRGVDTLYIEQDSKTKDSDGNYLVYLYKNDSIGNVKESLNFYLIHNKYASFEIQSPNVKYNYYLQK